MDLTHQYLPSWLLIAGWLGFAAALIAALSRGHWRSFAASLGNGHHYPAALVLMLVLWQLRAETAQGPALHLTGAALLTLMFDWRLAFLGLSCVLAGHTLNGAGSFAALGLNTLLMVGLPVAVSTALMRTVERFLPGQPFAYILLSGFAGGALSVMATLAAASAVLLGFATLDAYQLSEQFVLSSILLVFPEAFVTGGAAAWLSMFYPHLLRTWTPPWELPKRSSADD